MKSFKKMLAVIALMAVGVISQPASAGTKTDIILGIISAVADGRQGRDQYNDYGYARWICQTQSRGYTFRAEGRSYDEANYNVVNLCMNHPYGASSECRYATQCQQVSNGGGGGGGGYPYPQPAPRQYTCQTHARGQWYRAQARQIQRAQRQVLNQCANYSGKPRQCERNLQCGY